MSQIRVLGEDTDRNDGMTIWDVPPFILNPFRIKTSWFNIEGAGIKNVAQRYDVQECDATAAKSKFNRPVNKKNASHPERLAAFTFSKTAAYPGYRDILC